MFRRTEPGAGQVDRLYILDIDGKRFVVDQTWEPSVTAAQRVEQGAVVESLTIATP